MGAGESYREKYWSQGNVKGCSEYSGFKTPVEIRKPGELAHAAPNFLSQLTHSSNNSSIALALVWSWNFFLLQLLLLLLLLTSTLFSPTQLNTGSTIIYSLTCSCKQQLLRMSSACMCVCPCSSSQVIATFQGHPSSLSCYGSIISLSQTGLLLRPAASSTEQNSSTERPSQPAQLIV